MNTKDKAKEFAKLKNPKLAEFPNLSAVYEYGIDCAMEMAEWKEQQMIDWVRKNAYRYVDTDNNSEGHLCERFLEDAFIDDFKKAMKGE